MAKILLALLAVSSVIALAYSHGMLLDPVARGSRWRYDTSAPSNFEDNELFCGGFTTQYTQNGGKCGLCGDDYAMATPRTNEHGGTFGLGVIVKGYQKQAQIPVGVFLTANHFGFLRFNLCNMDESLENEDCFDKYPLEVVESSSIHFPIDTRLEGWWNMTLQLPTDVTCKHCVLQWTYNTGNSWGTCEDGTGAIGCGDQEFFRTCSDISIL